MDEIRSVREALEYLGPGPGAGFHLRSGETLRGRYLGFDGSVARIRTEYGDEEIEIEEILDVFVEGVEGPPE